MLTKALFMLAIAGLLLAPNNPVGLLVLAAIAYLKLWRVGDVMEGEGGDPGGCMGCGETDQPDVLRSGDVT